MRGRKPVDPALKVLTGTRADRLGPPAAAAQPGEPECPGHLDEVARLEWDRLVGSLRAAGRLSPAYRPIIAVCCTTYSRWVEALACVAAEGLVFETDLGGVKPNPAVTIADRCEKALARYLDALGLTPASVNRLPAAPASKPQDALDALLSRRKKA